MVKVIDLPILNNCFKDSDQVGFLYELYNMIICNEGMLDKLQYITSGKGLQIINRLRDYKDDDVITNREIIEVLKLLNIQLKNPKTESTYYSIFNHINWNKSGEVTKRVLDSEFHVGYYSIDDIELVQCVYETDFKKELNLNLNVLKTVVIGQDNVVEDILLYLTYILNLKKLARSSELIKPPIQTLFLQGMTGQGKTFIIESIAKLLNIPAVTFDTSRLTAEGYIGSSIDDILILIRHKQEEVSSPNTPIIVLLDEMDKIAESKDIDNHVGTTGAQRNLLKLLEMESSICEVSRGVMEIIDLTNVVFLFAGAFSKYKSETEVKKVNIGFGKQINEVTIENAGFKMSAEDLIEAGIMPELAGRIGRVISLNKLTKNDYKTILCASPNSFLVHNKIVFSEMGVKIDLNDEEIEQILNETEKLKLGVRGLNTVTTKFFIDKAKKELYA